MIKTLETAMQRTNAHGKRIAQLLWLGDCYRLHLVLGSVAGVHFFAFNRSLTALHNFICMVSAQKEGVAVVTGQRDRDVRRNTRLLGAGIPPSSSID